MLLIRDAIDNSPGLPAGGQDQASRICAQYFPAHKSVLVLEEEAINPADGGE
ncbi:hypothetical protein M404DRAFT_1006717 [Pisolithus tinctorius Marx 270]|uniref:Uncharacterized protein n=1 Tax=Pisolithus tinctorius Marx 270 TaxID=870435 RepID=A0A0C3IHP6_PISTI|nr:hypothetical protein M404DRAFT_1006717 [Pisolithus tinctorius Marx 270]